MPSNFAVFSLATTKTKSSARMRRLMMAIGFVLLLQTLATLYFFNDAFHEIHDDIPTTAVRNDISRNPGDANYNDATTADRIWERYAQNVLSGEHDTMELLKLYDCPLYSDRFGVSYEETETETNAAASKILNAVAPDADSSPEAPYSRIPTEQETWSVFEEAYYFSVGMKGPEPSAIPKTKQQHHHHHQQQQQQQPLLGSFRGMKIPYEIRYDSTIGRTIHATGFVPQGTMVWDGSYTASFISTASTSTTTTTTTAARNTEKYDDAEDASVAVAFPTFRRFLDYLHNKEQHNAHGWACDALMWTYTSNPMLARMLPDETEGVYTVNRGKPSLCIAFDHGSLFNDARGDEFANNLDGRTLFSIGTDSDGEELFDLRNNHPLLAVVVSPPERSAETRTTKTTTTPSFCQVFAMYAARDIQPGEEIRYDYGMDENDDTNNQDANDGKDNDSDE